MATFKRYNLSDTQIRQLANVFFIEQGNVTGVKACASHACNYLEKWQSKKYTNPYDCVLYSGWWGKEGSVRDRMAKNSASQAMIDGVRDVICNGNRTLPSYIDEYDWINDIVSAKNYGTEITNKQDRSQYKSGVTVVKNRYGSTWTFYCFPDGVNGINDPFGYIWKPANSSEVIEVNEAHSGTATASGNSVSVKKEKAASFMESIAKDDAHGYDQAYRWGEKGDFDCSSLMINAWEYAGVPVKKNGATYTGNMYAVFTSLGFKDVTKEVNLVTGAGMERSDVLLNHVHHTAMYLGNGKEVEASVNERGTATGGTPGDQTGKEILIRDYRNFPWDAVLRYVGEESGNVSLSDTLKDSIPNYEKIQNKAEIKLSEVEYGSCNASVLALQKFLNLYGYVGRNGKELEEDGEFGANTLFALKEYQEAAGLNVDGVCGRNTWNKLKEGLKT